MKPDSASDLDESHKGKGSGVIAIIPAYNEELTISIVVHLTDKYVD